MYKFTSNINKEEYDKLWTGLEPQIKQFEEPETKKGKSK